MCLTVLFTIFVRADIPVAIGHVVSALTVEQIIIKHTKVFNTKSVNYHANNKKQLILKTHHKEIHDLDFP